MLSFVHCILLLCRRVGMVLWGLPVFNRTEQGREEEVGEENEGGEGRRPYRLHFCATLSPV